MIVGAGFGGLECARKLNRAAVDVLLLDRSGYHLFTPLLYQVATALLNPSEIAYPLRALFRKSPNVRVSTATVTGVDLRRRVVHASLGEEIPYDYVVLATGSTSNYHGNAQLAENSIGLKTLEDGPSCAITCWAAWSARTMRQILTSGGRFLRSWSPVVARVEWSTRGHSPNC